MSLLQKEQSLQVSADKAGMNRETARKYRYRTGSCPASWPGTHWRTRADAFTEVWGWVAHARRLLATTDAKVLDIAMQAGFGSASQFYNVFHQVAGQTPRQYASLHRVPDPEGEALAGRGRGKRERGRVETWRGGLGSAYPLPALSSAGASLAGHAPFPRPAHRTGRADFPHPALGEGFMLSPTEGFAVRARRG